MSDVAVQRVAARRVDVGAWVMRLVFLGLGLTVLVAGLNYGLRTEDGLVGPGLMPFAAGLVTLLASLWEIGKSWLADRAASSTAMAGLATADPASEELDNLGRNTAQRGRAVFLVFGALLAGTILTHLIGLLLSLALMVLVLVAFVERKPWWAAVLAGTGTFLFGWLVFGIALRVPLPTGLLGLI